MDDFDDDPLNLLDDDSDGVNESSLIAKLDVLISWPLRHRQLMRPVGKYAAIMPTMFTRELNKFL